VITSPLTIEVVS